MPLSEEFEQTGNFLFRNRSWLPLLFLPVALAGIWQSGYFLGSPGWEYAWEIVCLAVCVSGELFRCLTVGFVPSGTSGRITDRPKASTLNTTGVYSIVRHPLYTGNYVVGLGISLFPAVWWLPVIYTFAFWVYYERIMYAEEAFLRREFGEPYIEWASGVPGFIPKPRQWRTAELTFSWGKMVRREYTGFMAILAVTFVLQTVKAWRLGEGWYIHPVWPKALVVGFVVYLFIMLIEKKTKILHRQRRSRR